MELKDLIDCDKCGCVFNKHKAIFKEHKQDWYGTDCVAKCPACKKIIKFNLGDGYYK